MQCSAKQDVDSVHPPDIDLSLATRFGSNDCSAGPFGWRVLKRRQSPGMGDAVGEQGIILPPSPMRADWDTGRCHGLGPIPSAADHRLEA